MNSLIVLVGVLALSSATEVRDKRQYNLAPTYAQGHNLYPLNYQPEQFYYAPNGYNNPNYRVKVPVTYTFNIANPQRHPASFQPYYAANNVAYQPAPLPYAAQYSPQEYAGGAWANVASTAPFEQIPRQYETETWDVGSANKNWGSKTKTTGIAEQRLY